MNMIAAVCVCACDAFWVPFLVIVVLISFFVGWVNDDGEID